MLPGINQIVYATDLSPGSSHVFRYALSLASKHQAQITILHVVEPLSNFAQSLVELHISRRESENQHASIRQQLLDKLQQRLHDFCKKEACANQQGLVADIKVIEGQPAETIARQATELDADIIIMGTHQHSVVGEALLGSTAHKVLHKVTLPVLLVPIPDGCREEGF